MRNSAKQGALSCVHILLLTQHRIFHGVEKYSVLKKVINNPSLLKYISSLGNQEILTDTEINDVMKSIQLVMTMALKTKVISKLEFDCIQSIKEKLQFLSRRTQIHAFKQFHVLIIKHFNGQDAQIQILTLFLLKNSDG